MYFLPYWPRLQYSLLKHYSCAPSSLSAPSLLSSSISLLHRLTHGLPSSNITLVHWSDSWPHFRPSLFSPKCYSSPPVSPPALPPTSTLAGVRTRHCLMKQSIVSAAPGRWTKCEQRLICRHSRSQHLCSCHCEG